MATQKKDDRFVQTFGKKKNATAVAICRAGKGEIRVNGVPIDLVEPEIIRTKLLEPILLLGLDKFAKYDIKMSVRGGGHVSRVFALRIALARAILAYTQKFVDETTKNRLKELLLAYDRGILVPDPRRCEPKKYGGRGARAKKQKSYR